ncbi:MAG: hypothetical protein GY870_08405, partial [archaeon]|nr:hypothetical protein [archaeon]
MEKPVTILGGGAAATTMAADLSLRGIKVIFCEHPNFKKNIQNALDTGKIQISGLINGTPDIFKVTTDIKEAVTLSDVEIINVVMPALGHDTFFKEMIPHLKDGQIIVVWSGDAGSLRLAKLINDMTPER